ncbi:MAG: hypothetical protein IT405_03035 [Candidatus Yanofskybacteria bacterium]|nr:hypothetical protein [Candidatus Yanofskybacteria bacterium]
MRHSYNRTLGIASFVAVVALVATLSVHTLTSIYQDIGRHIRIGDIIWSTRRIPETNLFSYTAPDFPFSNHHWLGSLALFAGDRLVGLRGLIVAKALLLALSFGLALAASWKQRIALPASVAGVAGVFALIERTDVRPEVLSFVFVAWFLFVLYRKERSSAFFWTLPVIQLLWVNTHIYFFMGPFVWVAFLIGQSIAARSFRDWCSSFIRSRYAGMTALLVFATLLNPSGIHGAFYPLAVWGNYGYSIAENQTPFFLLRLGYPPMTTIALGVLMAMVAASFAANWRRVRENIGGMFLVVVTGGLALAMVRNFPLFALCALPVTLKNIGEREWRWGGRGLLGAGALVVGLIAASAAADQVYPQAGLQGKHFGLSVPAGYQESVDFYRQAGIHGPLFNNFDVGSFLIWKLPEEPVFIDGRPEAYPADFIQQTYIPMQESATAWRAGVERYGINALFWNTNDMTPWSHTFVERITHDPQWVTVYHGQGILIMVRDAPQNAEVIRQFRLK